MNNIYYDPEKFGLETVGEISWSEPNYDFDLTVVWKQARGKFFFASDSGCSCPSPFEWAGVGDLAGPYTKVELRKHLMSMVNDRDTSWGNSVDNLKGQVLDILSRI